MRKPSRGPKLVNVTVVVTYKANKRRHRSQDEVRTTVVHNVPEGDAKAFERAWRNGSKKGIRLESIDQTEGGLYNLEVVTSVGVKSC